MYKQSISKYIYYSGLIDSIKPQTIELHVHAYVYMYRYLIKKLKLIEYTGNLRILMDVSYEAVMEVVLVCTKRTYM